jgi:hypothetical protein
VVVGFKSFEGLRWSLFAWPDGLRVRSDCISEDLGSGGADQVLMTTTTTTTTTALTRNECVYQLTIL